MLTRMLQQVRADHADLLAPHELTLVGLLLPYSSGNPFPFAALGAIGQVGTVAAIPAVTKFQHAARVTGRMRDDREARYCLELLQTRADSRARAQTLLRASASQEFGNHEMLRPTADSGPHAATEQLLHAGNAAGVARRH